MKITDFALIFLAIIMPVILVVYINVSFTIKSFQQELYYKKIVDTSIQDAMQAMKEVESEDPEIDYGYSGSVDNKISINAKIAKNKFLESMYNNLDIKWVQSAELYVQQFIPVMAIIDYNGVYISSIDTYSKEITSNRYENITEHILKPKRYYAYSYAIRNDGTIEDDPNLIANINNFNSIHHIEFTLDDRITHYGSKKVSGVWEDYELKSFFMSDTKNNTDLYDTLSNQTKKDEVVKNLQDIRKSTIVSVITNEMIYAANKNNTTAKENGITYNFIFPDVAIEDMYRYIENTGMIVLVQGLKVGNKYLNYCAYGGGDIALKNRYYFSVNNVGISNIHYNLYHKDPNCPEYKNGDTTNLIPKSVDSKSKAAAATVTQNGVEITGFYPCPICNP